MNFSFAFAYENIWWRWWDSNPWPPACRAGALPAELHPHFKCRMLSANAISLGFAVSPVLRLWEQIALLSNRVGIELSSRTVSRKVFSPLQSLTSVFGMGTGGPSAFITPTIFFSKIFWSLKIEQHLLFLSLRISVNLFCLFYLKTFAIPSSRHIARSP